MNKKTTVTLVEQLTGPTHHAGSPSLDTGPLIHPNRWIKLSRTREDLLRNLKSVFSLSKKFILHIVQDVQLGEQGREEKDPELFQTVSDGLKRLYRTKLFPLEDTYRFHDFHSPALEDADFDNKAHGTFSGSVLPRGKTTFIRHLMEQDFPGMRIGPEPTTDSFIAVMYGDQEGLIPGNALVVDPKKPFRKLNAFGNAFLNR